MWGGGNQKGATKGIPPADPNAVGFDCSGLVLYAYGNNKNVRMDHNAQLQYKQAGNYRPARSNLRSGDLVFFGKNNTSITHVGISLGGDRMVHAPRTGEVVKVDTIGNRSYVGSVRPGTK